MEELLRATLPYVVIQVVFLVLVLGCGAVLLRRDRLRDPGRSEANAAARDDAPGAAGGRDMPAPGITRR